MIYTAIALPLRLSFIDDAKLGWEIADYIVDFLFFVDIIVNFMSAYFDSEDNLIFSRRVRVLRLLFSSPW